MQFPSPRPVVSCGQNRSCTIRCAPFCLALQWLYRTKRIESRGSPWPGRLRFPLERGMQSGREASPRKVTTAYVIMSAGAFRSIPHDTDTLRASMAPPRLQGCCRVLRPWEQVEQRLVIPHFPADLPSKGSQTFSPPSKTQHGVKALGHFSLPPLKLWISCSIQPNPFPCLLLAGRFRTPIPFTGSQSQDLSNRYKRRRSSNLPGCPAPEPGVMEPPGFNLERAAPPNQPESTKFKREVRLLRERCWVQSLLKYSHAEKYAYFLGIHHVEDKMLCLFCFFYCQTRMFEAIKLH